MKLTFQCIDTLPRLAWCARLIKALDTVEVLHGSWVEIDDGFFCEGAWSGDFMSHGLDTSILMGSGGKIIRDKLLIATPNHTLERIFLLRNSKTLLVSNSLAFILAQANDSVNPHSLLYSVKLASIVNGIQHYCRTLPTRNGNKVHLYYHCNFLINSELQTFEKPKETVCEFVNYADYKAFLRDQVIAIHANANDFNRKMYYCPITTISSGYDSSASAVLAREVGCTEALTFAQARGDDPDGAADSGAEIALRLGMQASVFNRLDYLNEKDFPEAEFFGWGAQEAPWSTHLKGRLLFTGFHGDKVWDRNCKNVSPHILRGDPSGHNLNEFRLRVGWIHLPVPFLGCTSHPSIHRISNSEEMAPWSLMNHYDRPIPRRLVEEAGVGRHLFGTKKRATALGLDSEGLKERMTKESFEDFKLYYSKNWNSWMTIKKQFFMLLRYIYAKHNGLNKRITTLLYNYIRLQVKLPVLIPRGMRIGRYGNLDQLSLLFHWSLEKIIPRYMSNSRLETKG